MNDAAVRAKAAMGLANRRLAVLNAPVALGRLRRQLSAEAKLNRELRLWEQGQVSSALHHNANVALVGVNVDPMYMSFGRW